MTLIIDEENKNVNQEHSTLISNEKLNSSVLKLPPVPAEYLSIRFLLNEEELEFKTELFSECTQPFASSCLYKSPLRDAKIISRGEDVKKIIEIELNSNNYKDFKPGDTIGILPSNTYEEVEFVLRRLNLLEKADVLLRVSSIKSNKSVPNYIPEYGTLSKILLWCLDLRSIPKKSFLRCLSTYTKDLKQKQRLEQLSSIQGAEDYRKFILENGTTIVDILTKFTSCMPPVERLFENIPRLMPRPYSICSSPLDANLKIILSVTDYRKNKYGVCSGWLYQLVCQHLDIEKRLGNLTISDNLNDLVNFYFRKPSNFHLPEDNNVPIIMIGPGTGVAPFVGFLKHRRNLLKSNNKLKFGAMWLFYGCRYSNRDFIFKNELNRFLEDGLLTQLLVSFSRESNEIKYVQDNLKCYRNEIFDLMFNKNAVIYVCGNGKRMAVDVKTEICKCIQNGGQMSDDDALKFVLDLVKCSRYIEDVWC